MKVREFLSQIEESYKKEFPNSRINASLSKCLSYYISINCYIAKSKDEVFNGYFDNDILNVRFCSKNYNNLTLDDELNDDFCLECCSKHYLTKPDVSYMAYGSRELKYRKCKGAEKNIKALERFFKNLKKSLIEDIKNDNIHDSHLELLKTKLSI